MFPLFVTDEVIECGVCHGASMSLLPYLRKHTEHDSIGVSDMIAVACENVPAKYYQIVSTDSFIFHFTSRTFKIM